MTVVVIVVVWIGFRMLKERELINRPNEILGFCFAIDVLKRPLLFWV